MSTILKNNLVNYFGNVGLFQLRKEYFYHKVLLMYKSKNELAPEYLSDLIIIPHIIKNKFYWLKDNHMT
jgi:hypothetical protein